MVVKMKGDRTEEREMFSEMWALVRGRRGALVSKASGLGI